MCRYTTTNQKSSQKIISARYFHLFHRTMKCVARTSISSVARISHEQRFDFFLLSLAAEKYQCRWFLNMGRRDISAIGTYLYIYTWENFIWKWLFVGSCSRINWNTFCVGGQTQATATATDGLSQRIFVHFYCCFVSSVLFFFLFFFSFHLPLLLLHTRIHYYVVSRVTHKIVRTVFRVR